MGNDSYPCSAADHPYLALAPISPCSPRSEISRPSAQSHSTPQIFDSPSSMRLRDVALLVRHADHNVYPYRPNSQFLPPRLSWTGKETALWPLLRQSNIPVLILTLFLFLILLFILLLVSFSVSVFASPHVTTPITPPVLKLQQLHRPSCLSAV